MSERTSGVGGVDLDWLVEDLVHRLAGDEQAIVLSADGLLISRSLSISREDGDHLAAVASGLQSLAKGTARHFGGGAVQQTVVEMDNRLLVVTAAGQGACLAVLADAEADLGMIAYEVNLLVKRVGSVLSAAPRHPQAAADAR